MKDFSVSPWNSKPDKQVTSKAISTTVLCASFYFLQVLAQKCFGKIGFHGGRSNLFLTPVGLVSTVSTLLISQNIEGIVRKNAHQWGIGGYRLNDYLIYKPLSPKQERRDNVKRLLLGLGTFIVLEQNLFKTSFPSSVITLGVFANLRKRFSRSVESQTAIATPSQRIKIQRLGKLFGCHHCGSRQIFTLGKGFIADHMPPTKIAERLSKIWWRRIFHRPIQQRLWPQCQKCFSLQGMAVKNHIHTIAYHHVFKQFHLAPGIAFLLVQNKWVNDHLDQYIDPLVDRVETVVKKIEKAFSK